MAVSMASMSCFVADGGRLGFSAGPRSFKNVQAWSSKNVQAWSSKGSFCGGQVVPLLKRGGERQVQTRRKNYTTQAVFRTNSKEDTYINVEIQRGSESPFDSKWLLDEYEPRADELGSIAKESSGDNYIANELVVENVLAEITAVTGTIIDDAVTETAELLRNGKSSLGTKGGDKNEFQLAGLELGSADINDPMLEEAVAEAAKALRTKGSTLGQKDVYNENEVEVQQAMKETVKAIRGRQSSLVRNLPSNAEKRRQFWSKFHISGLKKDDKAIKSSLEAAKPQKEAAKPATTRLLSPFDILANDITYVKKSFTNFGSRFRKKVGDVVALRTIEDETAPPTPPVWPTPRYPDLRGNGMALLAADWKTMGSYASYVQDVFRSFQVPLQSEYDPDQVAAYFYRRPHVLLFRLLEVGVAFGSVALERSLSMATLKRNELGEVSEEDELEVTLKTAASLKQALLGLGTTFIKVAQSMSARPDLIGTETAKVLSELQDRLPPFPKEEALAIIENELGCRASEVFSYLSEEPVAAASFGQVYRGRTKSGEDVAVKVQRPDLLFKVARDVYILRIAFMIVKRVAKLSNNYALIADEIGQGLYGELDYRKEASNAAEFALAHKHIPWLYVPKTLSYMTGRKLLVMEWLNGDRPFDLQSTAKGLPYEDGTLPSQEVQQEASRRLLNMVNKGTEAALIQLLETGVMHADPHPGNILLGRDGQMQFIDFGLITHMDKKHQGAMLAAIAHLVNGDWQSLVEDLADMDVVKPTTDRFAVRLALERAFGEGPDAIIKDGVPDPNFSFNKIVKKFFKIAYKFRFRLPPYYTLVLRSLASLEGFGLAVNPDFKTFGSAYPYTVRRVLLDYSPTTQRILRSLLLTEERAVKWDSILRILEISQKSVADRAALEKTVTISGPEMAVTIPTAEEAAPSVSEPGISNIAGLLFSRKGVGIRRVIYEADAKDLARMLISARAAKYRRIVAERLGETLLKTLKTKYSKTTGTTSTSQEPSTATSTTQPSPADRFVKDRRLQVILKSMVGRLQWHPFLMVRAGWSFVSIAVWAMALAFHNFAIHLSDELVVADSQVQQQSGQVAAAMGS